MGKYAFKVFFDMSFNLPNFALDLGVIDPTKFFEMIEYSLQCVADLQDLFEFEPAHFLDASKTFGAINFVVSIIKPMVTYGSKVLACASDGGGGAVDFSEAVTSSGFHAK